MIKSACMVFKDEATGVEKKITFNDNQWDFSETGKLWPREVHAIHILQSNVSEYNKQYKNKPVEADGRENK